MIDVNMIYAESAEIHKRKKTLEEYRENCIRIGDHHGVQDASSDLREIEAVINALTWVLGGRATVGV